MSKARAISRRSSEADVLRNLKSRGATSHVLDARLQWTEAEGFCRYARMMQGVERVYPEVLPTQASGRWSTSHPPLVNFPPALKHAIIPDPDTFWVKYDLDAIEGRVAAYRSKDIKDIESYSKRYDVHTLTTCDFYGHEYPPNLVDPNTSPECESWRQSWNPVWGPGKDDRRRHMVKTCRYAMTYSDPYNYSAILQAKDVEKLGLTIEQLLEGGKKFVATRGHYEEWKKSEGMRVAMAGIAYTHWGAPRHLYGPADQRARDGISHEIQGYVSDLQHQIFLAIQETFPDAWLVLNGHDSGIWGFPLKVVPTGLLGQLRSLVEHDWPIDDAQMYTPASWEVWWPDGSVEKVEAS